MTPRECAEFIAKELRTIYPTRNWPNVQNNLLEWSCDVRANLPSEGPWKDKFKRALIDLDRYHAGGSRILVHSIKGILTRPKK